MSRRHAGFTLLELLVVIAVFGLLMLGLGRGLRTGLNAWNAQSRMVATYDQLDATDRALRLLIRQMMPNGNTGQAKITGQPDRLDFVTHMPSAVALATNIIDATLMVDDDHRLVLLWTPHRHEQPVGAPPDRTVTELLGNVAHVTFSYWHPTDAAGNGGGWQDMWEEPASPALVKIHIEFREGDVRHWPDVVATPALDQAL